MSIQVTYGTDHISLLCDLTTSNALKFCFVFYVLSYVFYCNLKQKDHIRRIINSKKKEIFIYEVSIIIIFIHWKLGSVGPVQEKIKLPPPNTSLLHLMRAIACAHASTRFTSLICVNKKHMSLLFMTLIVWDIGTKKIKERTKTSNLIVDQFSLTIVNLLLAWMLCFHVWLQNKGKYLFWREYFLWMIFAYINLRVYTS